MWEKNNTYGSRDFVPVVWQELYIEGWKSLLGAPSLISQQQLWISDTIVRSIVTNNTENTCFDRGGWIRYKSQCGLRVSKWGEKQRGKVLLLQGYTVCSSKVKGSCWPWHQVCRSSVHQSVCHADKSSLVLLYYDTHQHVWFDSHQSSKAICGAGRLDDEWGQEKRLCVCARVRWYSWEGWDLEVGGGQVSVVDGTVVLRASICETEWEEN